MRVNVDLKFLSFDLVLWSSNLSLFLFYCYYELLLNLVNITSYCSSSGNLIKFRLCSQYIKFYKLETQVLKPNYSWPLINIGLNLLGPLT